MKITWFGQSALRLHLGGQVVVIDADTAFETVDRSELRSGADWDLMLKGPHERLDGLTWRPRPAQRLLEAGDALRPLDVRSPGENSVLLDPDEDMPVVVIGGAVPPLGRWAEKCVLVMVGQDMAGRTQAVIDAVSPRLIALAAGEAEIDAAIAAVRDRLDGTGLVALEPGLALEV